MSRFKVGDKIRRVGETWEDTPYGYEATVLGLLHDNYIWFEGKFGNRMNGDERNWELVTPSIPGPIVTEVVTVTRIQPGVYGELEVLHTDLPIYARLKLNREVLTSAEIRKIIEQMSAIADHLESQKP